MIMGIIAAIISVILGVLAEGLGAAWNMSGIGAIVAVAVMGAFIICLIEQKK